MVKELKAVARVGVQDARSVVRAQQRRQHARQHLYAHVVVHQVGTDHQVPAPAEPPAYFFLDHGARGEDS